MSFMVAFDLEGPLSPQDNAYEVMGRLERGYDLFERLSRYDDVLTLRGREGYEPGDTLMLLVPFLLAHGITAEEIAGVSLQAGLVPGAGETAGVLQQRGIPVFIISTSYCQHAHSIAARVGVPVDSVACTLLPLAEMSRRVTEEDRAFVREVERQLLDVPSADEAEIGRLCDAFFWDDLPSRDIGRLVQVRVVGGERKTAALSRFAARSGAGFGEAVVVGDSITDFKMLAAVDKAGGLAIVFNGNEYALPYGTCGVAAGDLTAILPVVEAFLTGGRAGARQAVEQLRPTCTETGPVYDWLASPRVSGEVIAAHRAFRQKVRGQAAKLG
jgi:energy-converting hydrogenase A subunit R